MTSQVIFKIDRRLKEQAMRKARSEGVPFASILKLATRAYVRGALDVELVAHPKTNAPKINAKTRKMLIRESKEIKENKNISPRFDNVRDAIDHLKNR